MLMACAAQRQLAGHDAYLAQVLSLTSMHVDTYMTKQYLPAWLLVACDTAAFLPSWLVLSVLVGEFDSRKQTSVKHLEHTHNFMSVTEFCMRWSGGSTEPCCQGKPTPFALDVLKLLWCNNLIWCAFWAEASEKTHLLIAGCTIHWQKGTAVKTVRSLCNICWRHTSGRAMQSGTSCHLK